MEVKELASKLKITVQAVGKIENGGVDLNLYRIVEIAHILETSLSDILDISNGDIMNYHSYNNSGGYHVQRVDTIKINENDSQKNFLAEFERIAQQLMISTKIKL